LKDERLYLVHMIERGERIAGFRDVLIHQYAGVDLAEVWKRIEQDLPPLLRHLRAGQSQS